MNKYETIYLDWFNNFYSTKYMSSYYNINQSKLKRQISRGRNIHYKKHFGNKKPILTCGHLGWCI